MRYVMTLLFVGLLALGLPADGRAQVVELYDADTLPPLKGRNGYIVIGVDSGDTESFLVATKLVAHNRKARFIGGKLQTTNKKFRIELAGRETGFYFAVLPPGLYQITEINYPYFNLPFRLSSNKGFGSSARLYLGRSRTQKRSCHKVRGLGEADLFTICHDCGPAD